MNISVSRINIFNDCPRKYWYIYEMEIKTKKSEGMTFGSAVHEGLENYYKGKDPMKGVDNSLFGKKEKGDEPREGVDPYKLHQEAKRIFKVYKDQAPEFKPLFVEYWFEVPMIHPKTKETLPVLFRGKIDLITVNCWVVDHKTASGKSNGFFESKNVLQGNGYAFAYYWVFGELPKKFIVNTLIKGNTKREPSFENKPYVQDMDDICYFFDECKRVSTAIIKKETREHPNKRHCRMCQFKGVCPFAN